MSAGKAAKKMPLKTAFSGEIMGICDMGKAFPAGVSWAQQLHKEKILQNVPGTVLFLPSTAAVVEWTV